MESGKLWKHHLCKDFYKLDMFIVKNEKKKIMILTRHTIKLYIFIYKILFHDYYICLLK